MSRLRRVEGEDGRFGFDWFFSKVVCRGVGLGSRDSVCFGVNGYKLVGVYYAFTHCRVVHTANHILFQHSRRIGEGMSGIPEEIATDANQELPLT